MSTFTTTTTIMNKKSQDSHNTSNDILSNALCHSTMFDNNLNDELLQTTFKWMFWSPHHLVKDDVFFAPSSISTTTLNSIDNNNNNNWVPTPCLSPVTSPSDFLYDQEPLFDGIENDYHKEEEQELTEEEKRTDEYTAISSLTPNNIIINLHHLDNDDDWSTLFSGDEYDFLPLTPSSTITSNSQLESDHDEQDVLLDFDINNKQQDKEEELVMNQTDSITTTTKRKRNMDNNNNNNQIIEICPSKKLKSSFTLFQNLTKLGIDWCRYCGTTEGVNWRPGPWGKRTLCNKHGCDYKGYGLASRLPRLDLSAFTKEKLQERKRPIVQQFCVICQLPENSHNNNNKLIACEGGCSRAYHQHCHTMRSKYCSTLCHENKQKNKVVVDLPRKYLPLMRLQQQKKI